jgi:hypothetical protein
MGPQQNGQAVDLAVCKEFIRRPATALTYFDAVGSGTGLSESERR